MLIPLIDGRVSGWPPWSWILLAASAPAGAVLAAWEIRLARRGEPVLQVPNLAFVLAAWLCGLGLPKTLAAELAEETPD